MKIPNIGVAIDQGADFNLTIGVSDMNGPVDLTGYEFLCQMRLTTDSSSPVAGGIKASGTIVFSSNPANGDTITVNGVVITFSSTPVDGEILIGGSANITAQRLFYFLSASTNPALKAMSYSIFTTTITAVAAVVGVAGNTITLATDSADIELSGATLSGGVDPAEFVFTVLNQSTDKGRVKWSLPKDQIDSVVASTSNALQTNRLKTPYVFDIKMKDVAGLVTRIVEGIIYISPQATKETF